MRDSPLDVAAGRGAEVRGGARDPGAVPVFVGREQVFVGRIPVYGGPRWPGNGADSRVSRSHHGAPPSTHTAT
jgi:hypothetical protein